MDFPIPKYLEFRANKMSSPKKFRQYGRMKLPNFIEKTVFDFWLNGQS